MDAPTGPRSGYPEVVHRPSLRALVVLVFVAIFLLPTLISSAPWLVPVLLIAAVGSAALGARSGSGGAARARSWLQDAARPLVAEPRDAADRHPRAPQGAPPHAASEWPLGSVTAEPRPPTPEWRTDDPVHGPGGETPRRRPHAAEAPHHAADPSVSAASPVDLTNPGFDITSSNSAEPQYGSWA